MNGRAGVFVGARRASHRCHWNCCDCDWVGDCHHPDSIFWMHPVEHEMESHSEQLLFDEWDAAQVIVLKRLVRRVMVCLQGVVVYVLFENLHHQ